MSSAGEVATIAHPPRSISKRAALLENPEGQFPIGTCGAPAKVVSGGLTPLRPESDYTNNVGEVMITIPDHVGRVGIGPAANTPMSNTEPIDHE